MLRSHDRRVPVLVNARVGRMALVRVGLLLCSLLLAACNTTPVGGVRVVDRNGSGSASDSRQPNNVGQHIVQRGDTLYSIAFRFGWDWKVLAQRNNIAAPYVIKTGQIIRFDGRPSQPAAVASTPRANSSVNTKNNIAKAPPAAVKAPSNTAAVNSKAGVKPVEKSVPSNFTGRWTWPATGAVIGRFSSNGSLNKGVDIAGELGQPVLAASDGSVVYAGSGLRGYGELVIIKHSDTYVSAYGHNRRLLVREGQQVKVGQVIAEMGSTGTDRVKLHFEIRRQGKPVDPQQYLPKR